MSGPGSAGGRHGLRSLLALGWLLLVLGAGCGIKGPPRPPARAPASRGEVFLPDGGVPERP